MAGPASSAPSAPAPAPPTNPPPPQPPPSAPKCVYRTPQQIQSLSSDERKLDPDGNEWNSFSRLQCFCGAVVQVGTGGYANLVAHWSGKGHRVSLVVKGTTKVTSYFSKVVSTAKKATRPASFSTAIPKTKPAPSPQSDQTARALPGASASSAPTFKTPLIEELFQASRSLPDSVPIALETDVLAGFRVLPVFYSNDPDEQWEQANQIMHNAFGYLRSPDELKPFIRRGHFGIEALCGWLEAAIVRHGLPAAEFAPRVSLLIEAMKLLNVSLAPPHVSVPAPALASASVPSSPGNMCIDLTVSAPSSPLPMTAPLAPPHVVRPCLGFKIDLPPGLHGGMAYPWALTEETYPWEPNVVDRDLYLRSRVCLRSLSGSQVSCSECARFRGDKRVTKMAQSWAGTAARSTNDKYLNMVQKQNKLQVVRTHLRRSDLQARNDVRTLMRRNTALNTHQRFIRFVASKNVAQLGSAIAVSVRNGFGINGLFEKVIDLYEERYMPKGFSQDDYDLMAMVYGMGGRSAAIVVAHALGKPSIRALKRHRNCLPIEASAGYPTRAEVSRNLDAAFPRIIADLMPSSKGIVGVVAMVDEVCIEPRSRYHPGKNVIYGPCREHSRGYSLEFNSLDDANVLWDAIIAEKVHLGTEATVFALGPLLGETGAYTARPIHISASCKRETAPQHARLLETVLNTTTSHAKMEGSRIYSVATDGESKRGSALSSICLVQELDEDAEYYPELADIPLLNTLCGKDGITLDKDYKHLWKRLRKPLLSDSGVNVLGTLVTSDALKLHLTDCGHGSKIHSWFNPTDKQDVPVTIELFSAIMNLPPPAEGSEPGYARMRRAIQLLGVLYGCLIKPYTVPSYSLSDQLKDLSEAVHLIIPMYQHGRGSFMCLQSLADIMHAIKNVIFTVAKAKVDFPDNPLYIILLGTDRLEVLFGKLRTMIGSDANMDLYQAETRMTAAVECAEIAVKHPDWVKGIARRLRVPVLDASGQLSHVIDHVSPRCWTGDLSVRGVSIRTCWSVGRSRAVELLRAFDLDAEAIFRDMEAKGHDMLHPLGRPLFKEDMRGTDDVLEQFDDTDIATTSGSGSNDLEPDLEDITGAMLAEDNDNSALKHSPWVMVDGQRVYKASMLRLMSDPLARPGPKSTDRLKRVRGYERYDRTAAANSALDNDEADTILISDPAVTVLTCCDKLFLAVVQIASLRIEGSSTQAISPTALDSDSVEVGFQVLRLSPILPVVESESSTAPPEAVPMSELVDFDWSSDLTTVRLGNQDAVIRSRGRLVLPYSPVIQSKGPNGNQPRYLFASKELLAAAHLLFERVRAAPTIVIPNVVAVTAFPYPLDGKRCFVCEFDDDDAPVLATQSRLTCVICPDGRAVLKSAPALVEHNSSHILCDTRLKDTHTLCGFCLESGQCRFYLRKRHGTLQVDFTNSVCSKKPKTMSYAPAIQSSPNSPCSNFPVKCSLCSPLDHAIWRYALEHHIRHVHPDEDVEKHKSKWFITKAERDAMKKVFERVENARGPRKPKRDAPALVISDAHSSRLAFRAVELEGITAAETDENSNVMEVDSTTVLQADDSQDAEPDAEGEFGTDPDWPGASGRDDTPPRMVQAAALAVTAATNAVSVQSASKPSRKSVPSKSTAPVQIFNVAEVAVVRTSTGGMETRGQGKRTRSQITQLICDCGANDPVAGNESKRRDLVRCSIRDCAAPWYHRDCAVYPAGSDVFTCESCKPEARKKARLTAKNVP